MARRRAQHVQELKNVLQEQHAKEAQGSAGQAFAHNADWARRPAVAARDGVR
jgi:hypothetical protein